MPSDTDLDELKLYVEVSVNVPALDAAPTVTLFSGNGPSDPKADATINHNTTRSSSASSSSDTSGPVRTKIIPGNSYKPEWNEALRIQFDIHPGMMDLAFVSIVVKNAVTMGDDEVVAHYCASLHTFEQGERSQFGTPKPSEC